jgi:transposase InsO family protein
MATMQQRNDCLGQTLGNEQLKVACGGNLFGDSSEEQSGPAVASGKNRLTYLASERPHSSLGYRTPNQFAETLRSSLLHG